MNGGTCSAGANGGYVCTCPNCYSGTNCQSCKFNQKKFKKKTLKIFMFWKVNPCCNNPCLNGGTCSAGANGGYVCTCPNCYSGTNCQTCK